MPKKFFEIEILLETDRRLDIFQPPIKADGFSLADRMQEHRMLKGFYVTYVRQSDQPQVT